MGSYQLDERAAEAPRRDERVPPRWRSCRGAVIAPRDDRDHLDRDHLDRDHLDRDHLDRDLDRDHVERDHLDRDHLDRALDGLGRAPDRDDLGHDDLQRASGLGTLGAT